MIYYDKRGWAKFYGLTHPLSYLGILNFNYMRMGKFFIAAVLCLLSALGLVSCAPTQSDDCDYLPQSPSASEDIYSINVEDLTEGMRLSVLSAQGLLNRDGAEVYTYVGQDAWLLDFYKERGYVKEIRDYDDPYRLLSDICGDGISGIVVYDPEKKFTINLATNIAGVEDRIIVHPDDLQKVSEATGLTDVIDLRDMGFSDVKESFRWYMDNVFPELRRVGITVRYTRSVPVTLVPSMKAPAEQLYIAGPVYGRPLAGTLQPPAPEPFYRLALKTNLLADAALMPSLEAEYLIDEHWSVAAHGAVAWWSKDAAHKFYQIATVYPEARWWFRTREAWHGHYLGLFAGGTWYDLENGGRGYQGEGGFVGVSYGYMFPIAERLSLEAGIGLGYLYTKYREYLPVPYMGGTHYVYQQTSQMNYFGPLKVKLALVWRLWDTNRKGGGR